VALSSELERRVPQCEREVLDLERTFVEIAGQLGALENEPRCLGVASEDPQRLDQGAAKLESKRQQDLGQDNRVARLVRGLGETQIEMLRMEVGDSEGSCDRCDRRHLQVESVDTEHDPGQSNGEAGEPRSTE
jgi:hypothetical protein